MTSDSVWQTMKLIRFDAAALKVVGCPYDLRELHPSPAPVVNDVTRFGNYMIENVLQLKFCHRSFAEFLPACAPKNQAEAFSPFPATPFDKPLIDATIAIKRAVKIHCDDFLPRILFG